MEKKKKNRDKGHEDICSGRRSKKGRGKKKRQTQREKNDRKFAVKMR